MKQAIFILCLGILLNACSSSVEPTNERLGFEYFPLSKGLFHIYDVEEINYLATGEVVEEHYQLLEEISDSFLSDEDSTFIVYRFRREDEAANWEFIDTWQKRRTLYQAIVIEQNIPFVKISFPLSAGKIWDGNILNDQDIDDYAMDSIGFPYQDQNDQLIEKTVTIIENDNQDFIVEQDKRFNIYAKNIGLIYSRKMILQYCTDNNCLGQQLINTGVDYSQTLIEYGKN